MSKVPELVRTNELFRWGRAEGIQHGFAWGVGVALVLVTVVVVVATA